MKTAITLAAICLAHAAIPARGLEIRRAEGLLDKLPETYILKKACPFECCSYRTWKVKKDASLYDRPNGTTIVGKVRIGDTVRGLTGQVESRPLLVTVTADHVDDNGNRFTTGDKFYLLTYGGEGFFHAWADGKLFNMNAIGVKTAFEPYTKHPTWAEADRPYEHIWWQKVKTRKGVVGWTKENVFSGQDACG